MLLNQRPKLAILLAHGATALIAVQAAVFYGLVLRVRLLLGRWPEPYRPDPKDLDVGTHASIAMLGGLYVIVSPAIAIVLLGAAKVLGLSRRELLVAVIVYGVCYAAALAVFRIDPGRFGEWFMD